MTESYSRRKFVARCLQSGAVFLGVGLTAGGCTKKESPQQNNTSIDSCDDFYGVTEAELEKRKKFAYVKQAADPLKQCNSCKLYLPPKAGEKCGGCILFKGPVNANGSCTYWAPLD
jgi:hypothetical protein